MNDKSCYEVLDKVHSLEELVDSIRKELLYLRARQSEIELKMWLVGVVAGVVVTVGTNIVYGA